jgi:hypothetical protein
VRQCSASHLKLPRRIVSYSPPVSADPASGIGGGVPFAKAHASGSIVALQRAAAPPLHPGWQNTLLLVMLPLLSTGQQ